jgi:protein phosphatase-4 regulatory subunit 3
MNIGLKRKRRPAVGTGPKGHRPPLRTPILGSLVDYDDEEDTNQDESSSKSVPPQSSSSQPLSPETPPPSPKLAHRQVPTIPSSGPPPIRNPKDEDEEDNLLEALVRPRARSQSPSPPVMTMVPLKPLEKRRRNDDDDDELLDRLRKSKKPVLGSLKQGAVVAGRTKNGDDPPRKIKVKFGAASLMVASPTSSLTTTTDIDVKDGDTG